MSILSLIQGNIKKNEEKDFMIQISKEEAKILHKMGVPFGEMGISRSRSKKSKYYLCEQAKNLSLYNKIKK